jgi:hypothetical protein
MKKNNAGIHKAAVPRRPRRSPFPLDVNPNRNVVPFPWRSNSSGIGATIARCTIRHPKTLRVCHNEYPSTFLAPDVIEREWRITTRAGFCFCRGTARRRRRRRRRRILRVRMNVRQIDPASDVSHLPHVELKQLLLVDADEDSVALGTSSESNPHRSPAAYDDPVIVLTVDVVVVVELVLGDASRPRPLDVADDDRLCHRILERRGGDGPRLGADEGAVTEDEMLHRWEG